jgi:hypothetical protein
MFCVSNFSILLIETKTAQKRKKETETQANFSIGWATTQLKP